MRILHVIPGLNESSGPSQVLAKLSEFQTLQGAEVTICHVLGRGADPQRTFPEGVRMLGFPAKWLRKWAYAPELRRFLRAHACEFDIVHLHSLWLYPNLVAAHLARRAATPYLVRPAGSLEPWCLGRARLKKQIYYRLIERAILRNAARIHAVSKQEAEQIDSLGLGAKTLVLPNGIDPRDYQSNSNRADLITSLELPPAAKYLLFLSRIDPKKGLDLLIEAFGTLDAESLDVRLLIAGPDQHSYARELRHEAQRSPFASRIHFLGEVTGRRKFEVLQLADLFVLPTHSENFGVAILEALAAGTPALVSEHTPWSMLDERGAGRWLPRSLEAFTKAMNEFLRMSPSEAKTTSQAARDLANEYSWEEISRALLVAYQEIIAESTGELST